MLPFFHAAHSERNRKSIIAGSELANGKQVNFANRGTHKVHTHTRVESVGREEDWAKSKEGR